MKRASRSEVSSLLSHELIGQVITGIGFLGAGVILARHGAIVGVTSASAIWVLAAGVPVTIWAAAKVFRTGILKYGKRPGPREILYWFREK